MASSGSSDQPPNSTRWVAFPVLSSLLSVLVFLAPIAISIAAAATLARLIPRADGGWWEGVWWADVLLVPIPVFLLADRLARRFLPLAVLLKMTMVFPDRAPKRLAVARKAGTTRDLARRIEEATTHGVSDDLTLAAQQILALAASLSAHDRLTRGHSERVRALTDLIAEELALPAADRDKLRWSALLHDVGKLTVHPDVLNKADKLDDAEWAQIRNHPLEGARLTRRLAGWLGPWANSIAEHHEKFDGTGYPFGLAGAQISLGGRIVAVADSYDAMTAIRSYDKLKSPTAARAELARCAGTHFDPQVVRAFLQVSVGRLRAASGVLSWLGSLPFLLSIPGAAQVASVTAALSLVGGGVALGAIHADAQKTTQSASVQAVSGGSTTSGNAPSSSGGSSANPVSNPSGSSNSKSGTGNSTSKGGASSGTSGTSGGKTSSSTSTTTKSGSPGKTTTTTKPGTTTTTTTKPGTTTTTTTTTTLPPVAAVLVIQNGSRNAGKPDLGDEIIVTYSVAPNPQDFCSAWSSSAYPDLVSSNVVVNADEPSSGDDSITSVTDSVDCAGGFHFGSIDLGQRRYINNTETFGGLITSGSAQCNGSVTTGCTRIHWDGKNTLTITLGEPATGCPANKTPAVAVYAPDPTLGVSGTISSKSAVEF